MRRTLLHLLFAVVVSACTGGQAPVPDRPDAESPGAAGAAIAADVPDTEIYLADLAWDEDGPMLGEPRNITRRPGYDNQPKFMPDGDSLVYSSIRDGVQADIYRYLIAEDQTVAYVLTPESEYSPTPIPGQSGISVVRVEEDGTQRLWRFPAANAEPEVLLPDVTGVGYHAWLSGDQLAMFIVAEPAVLMVAGLDDAVRLTVTSEIGRSLARMPGEAALAFIDKQDAETWRVARYDLESGSLADLIDTPPASEDFAWTRDGGLFMGRGGELLYWDGLPDSSWQTVAEPGEQLSGRITRLDVSPDGSMLAFVVDPVVQQ